MTECAVLRCGLAGLAPKTWCLGPEWPPLEYSVCRGHHDRMEAGEPYAHDQSAETGSGAILMDTDLAALGLSTLTAVRGGPSPLLCGGEPSWVMTLEATRFGDSAPIGLSVILDDEAARKMRGYLDMWAPAT